MIRIVVLASTRGTVLQAIIEEIRAGKLQVELVGVISDAANCGALEKAESAALPHVFLDPKGRKRGEYDRLLAETVASWGGADLIVLAGYMRILSPWFVNEYRRRIINIHPSLLPDFPGMDIKVHAAVIAAGRSESGMTVHYVDESVDGGEIILQKKVTVAADETPESLKTKVQELEKIWYPRAIGLLAQKSLQKQS